MSTLLIADDSTQKIMLMQGMLHRGGWTGDIVTAATTEEAKMIIDGGGIDFGLIDFFIPSENGPAVISYLKEKNPDARIALVSSSDAYENQQAAKEAGAEACICTSYPADEIEKAFTDIIEEWRNEN